MVLVNLFGRQFQIVNGPGTTPNGTFALRSAPSWAGASSAEELVRSLSPAQVDFLVNVASWAENNLEGVTGTTTLNGKEVPQAAADMRSAWKGADFGGMSEQELRMRQKSKRVNVSDINSAASSAGISTSSVTPPNNF